MLVNGSYYIYLGSLGLPTDNKITAKSKPLIACRKTETIIGIAFRDGSTCLSGNYYSTISPHA